MPLMRSTKHKVFHVTADTTNLLANDKELGSCGKGVYQIWAKAAAAVDATITVKDGDSAVLDGVAIPTDTAGSTYPPIRLSDDIYWKVRYVGNGDTIPIDIADGTNGEVTVLVKYLG